MGKTVTIGGNRLGSGKKMQTQLKSYERSTHNLGYLWRSTMAPGTLVPFMVEPALPGDTFDIGLAAEALTLPTIGPLFGSFKLQLDVFQVPIRLYQAQLHNNKLYIGLDMDAINLPQLEITAQSVNFASEEPVDVQQINPSSLLAYLGIRGIGKSTSPTISRQFDATPLLAYWDIYKNYYANRSEEVGYYIHKGLLDEMTLTNLNGSNTITGETGEITTPIVFDMETSTTIHGTNLSNPRFNITIHDTSEPPVELTCDAMDVFQSILINSSTEVVLDNLFSEFDGWTWTNIVPNPYTADEPVLRQFSLDNLDVMREDILAAIKTPTSFMIDSTTYEPYGTILIADSNNRINSYYPLEGLAVKTYQSDIFNNWLNTEFIEAINDTSSVAITDNSFSIDTLNLAKKYIIY